MKLKHATALLLLLMLMLFTLISCAEQAKQAFTPSDTTSEIKYVPEGFLKYFNLKVKGEAVKFDITVPTDWKVKEGEYPEGLFWALANEYSKDAGLDLTLLKGKTVMVCRYELADGLPGQGSQSSYTYPSNVVMLVDDNHVAGAWLAFNAWNIGPSVKQKYLEELTGLPFEQWFYKQNLLIESEANKDLAAMDPVQLLDAFCKAIEAGDTSRANACMSPESMLDSLTINLQGNALYNNQYAENNSYIGNLLEAKLISYKLMDAESLKEIDSIGDSTKVIIAASMKIKWKDDAFNSPDGMQTRFALLKKYENGWKLQGLGTGP